MINRSRELDSKKIISFGSDICKRLKSIYYPNTDWHKVVKKEIPELFGRLKISAKECGFAEGKSEVEFLEFLISCPDQDLMDVLNEQR